MEAKKHKDRKVRKVKKDKYKKVKKVRHSQPSQPSQDNQDNQDNKINKVNQGEGEVFMRTRNKGITIFGGIFIALGVYTILYGILFHFIIAGKVKFLVSMLSIVGNLSSFQYDVFIISVIVILSGLLNIIIGIGLLRVRFWAWYLIIADQIIRIISLPNTGFIFGWQAYNPLKVLIGVGSIIFILWFFTRPQIRNQFLSEEERFRLKSWYSALIVLFLLLTLAVPGFVLGYKFVHSKRKKQQFLVEKPKLINLSQVDKALPGAKLVKREFFNFSFLVPDDFVIHGFEKNTGFITMGDITGMDDGFIVVEAKPALAIMRDTYKIMHFKNTYQFEKALYDNNWSVILMILRDIELSYYGDNRETYRYELPTVKGFVKSGYMTDHDKWIYNCSVYDKRGNDGIANITLMLKREDFLPKDAFTMISSIHVYRKEEADKYYRRGIWFLSKEDPVSAQFAFAHAYSLADKPEAGYMLAQTILMNGQQKFYTRGAAKIIEGVLALRPDYPEAQRLLESLNKKLGR